MVAVAELEAGLISVRTKAALAAAKRRGVKLGGNRGVTPFAKMHKASQAAIQARADARAANVAPIIAELQASGATSLRAIADGLNARKIPAARGNGEWTATRVMRVLERNAPFSGHDPGRGGRVGASVTLRSMTIGDIRAGCGAPRHGISNDQWVEPAPAVPLGGVGPGYDPFEATG